MDYEKMYKEALERARANYKADKEMGFLENCDMLELIFPELSSSEDERIRKLLVWQVHRNIEDETNDLAGSVYDGIKGHDPDLEESIEDWKRCLAYLEKQKERVPENEETGTRKEQKPEWSEEDEKMIKTIISVLERSSQVITYEQRGGSISGSVGCSDKYKEEIAWLKSLRPQPEQEWSEEDEQLLGFIYDLLADSLWNSRYAMSRDECLDRLTSLRQRLQPRPSWKPSEHQMNILKAVKEYVGRGSGYWGEGLGSLIEDLEKL